ncbi:hypothetical protein KFL_000090100 [Klebsormidium nitens]|uniref:AMP-activated protein kinase glycogen-binding domain-containing protein n=1 Tax=Klebsormidium nitens TaxID=105231 RepID=A0A1Y1HI70_KLENI|nr:hypothetical protein KFL_000090100 [Klebsormidium nitens]|eukprot:GAQ78164.1 hypothetical protein KFL_000090100 [Klebsormidium nitens]
MTSNGAYPCNRGLTGRDMEALLAKPIAVRGTNCITSPVHCRTEPPRGAIADLSLHHSLSARPIQSNHFRRLQNHSSVVTATPESSAKSQRPGLNGSSIASKAVGRRGFCSRALGSGDQPAQSGQQEAKSESDKASVSPPEQNMTEVMSESQFWRQLIDRSLGELSSSSGGGVASEVGDQLDVGQSSGKVKGVTAAPELTRTTGSNPPSSSSSAQTPGDSQNLGSTAISPESDSGTPQPAGPSPALEVNGVSSEAPLQPQISAQAKSSLNEGATSSPKAAFKRRETDLRMAPKPGGGVPRRSGPQVAEPLTAEDLENMAQLMGMSVGELERNSAGNGLTFEAAAAGPAGEREAEANAQQEKKLPRGTTTAPPGGRRPHVQEGRRPAPNVVLSRESGASVSSTNLEKVDRSELTKVRQSLNQKLSEANMYNRHLQREISARDAAVNESTLFLGALQTELKTLVEIAKEIAAGGPTPVTRKINGRYIQSHLASRLEDLHSQLAGQLQQVDVVRLREVPVTWLGVAEDVKLMGSFDGWTRGQHLSPETTGSYTLFSSVLQLRPGRYEVKFVVDGKWQLAPSWPVVGEGLSANNLLVVD